MQKSIITIIISFFLLFNVYSQTQIGYKDFKLGMNRNQVISIIKKMRVDVYPFAGQDGQEFNREEMHFTIMYQTERPFSIVNFEFNRNDFLYKIEIHSSVNETQKPKIQSVLKSRYGEPETRWVDGTTTFTYKVYTDIFVDFIDNRHVHPALIYYNKKIMDGIKKQIEERNRRREQINSNDY